MLMKMSIWKIKYPISPGYLIFPLQAKFHSLVHCHKLFPSLRTLRVCFCCFFCFFFLLFDVYKRYYRSIYPHPFSIFFVLFVPIFDLWILFSTCVPFFPSYCQSFVLIPPSSKGFIIYTFL